MTRPLREGERNKISISGKEMDDMSERGDFLIINELYGVRYATPRLPIELALAAGNFPILDWYDQQGGRDDRSVSKPTLYRVHLATVY